MSRRKSSNLKLAGFASIVTLIIALVVAGAALAEESTGIPPPLPPGAARPTATPTPTSPLVCSDQTVAVTTIPIIPSFPLILDGQLIGNFPVYDVNKEVSVVWLPFDFPPDIVEPAYEVLIRQFLAPQSNLGIYQDLKVAVHVKEGGEAYTFGNFNVGETVCPTCPSIVVVTPLRPFRGIDPVTGEATDLYQYILEGQQTSCPFLLR